MAYEKKVLIEWKDYEGVFMDATVSIDEAWNSLDDLDDNITWYFANEQQYREAFSSFTGIEGNLEFRIIRER